MGEGIWPKETVKRQKEWNHPCMFFYGFILVQFGAIDFI